MRNVAMNQSLENETNEQSKNNTRVFRGLLPRDTSHVTYGVVNERNFTNGIMFQEKDGR
jgi:hypothetical protein